MSVAEFNDGNISTGIFKIPKMGRCQVVAVLIDEGHFDHSERSKFLAGCTYLDKEAGVVFHMIDLLPSGGLRISYHISGTPESFYPTPERSIIAEPRKTTLLVQPYHPRKVYRGKLFPFSVTPIKNRLVLKNKPD